MSGTRHRSHNLHPAAVRPGLDEVDFIVCRWPVFAHPQLVSQRIKGQTKAVPNAIRIILGQISPLLEERIVSRDRAVVIQSDDDRCVIGCRASGEILELTTVVKIADHRIEFAIWTKGDGSAVVIWPRKHW